MLEHFCRDCSGFNAVARIGESTFVSNWLIALTGLIYLGVAIDQFSQKNMAMCIVYIGYAFANVGLYYLASK